MYMLSRLLEYVQVVGAVLIQERTIAKRRKRILSASLLAFRQQ